MIVEIQRTTPTKERQNALLKTRFTEVLNGVFEAGFDEVPQVVVGLTEANKSALQDKYAGLGGNRNPNYIRAGRVKALIQQGKSLSQIKAALRQFKGCGEHSVERDYAVLVKCKG